MKKRDNRDREAPLKREMRKIGREHIRQKKMCPFVKNPLESCYCYSMKTQHELLRAIQLCGGTYEKCDAYKKLSTDGVEFSPEDDLDAKSDAKSE